jgi:hypothetical protein
VAPTFDAELGYAHRPREPLTVDFRNLIDLTVSGDNPALLRCISVAIGTNQTYRGVPPFVRFRGQCGHTQSYGFDLFGRY